MYCVDCRVELRGVHPLTKRCEPCKVADARKRAAAYQRDRAPEVNAKNRAWRAANPEKAREYELAKKAKDPERYRAYYRLRARRKAGMIDATGELLTGTCALGCGYDGELVMDHDHGNHRRRGGLCDDCNKALGGFRDNPEVLRAAARYVEFWRENHARNPLTAKPAGGKIEE